MKRREFLQAAGATAMACSMSPRILAAANETPYLKTMGLQLWTVRNQMAEDVAATLGSVAKAGYHQVELMNTLEADEVYAKATDVGLKVTSAFIDWQSICRIGDEGVPTIESIVEKGQQLGLKYLVFGYIGKGQRETLDDYRRHADTANKAGQLCQEADLQLCYHNHSFEFEKLDGDQTGFDIFIDRFDERLVQFELDVFWAAIGGWDPVETIRRLGDRTAQLHLKDWKAGGDIIFDEGKVPHDAFQEVGDGVIDFPSVLAAAVEAKVDQCHVEQDQSPNPIESIGQSYRFLTSL